VKSPQTVPEVAPTGAPKLPKVLDDTLANGLRVLVVRKPGVPMVQARLRLAIGKPKNWGDGTIEGIASETIKTGTADRDQLAIASELQRLGGSLETHADNEDFVVFGNAVASGLADYLRLVADLLQNASHPRGEVDIQKAQTAQGLAIAHSQPPVRARYALLGRLFPGHPYGQDIPDPASVGAITAAQIRKFHSSTITPKGAVLVLVGDIAPARAMKAAHAAFGVWTGTRRATTVPTPEPLAANPLLVVHQPEAVQTNIRLGGRAVGRKDPLFPALQLAALVLGGGFTSRLNHNLREDKGYTYGAFAGLSHNQMASYISIGADVQTAVTAPALVETLYEIGRIATTPVTEDELGAARRYLAGQLALSIQTQAGLASYLASLTAQGLDLNYLRELPAATERVTVDDLQNVASTFLSPAALSAVMVGDADVIGDAVGRLTPVEVMA